MHAARQCLSPSLEREQRRDRPTARDEPQEASRAEAASRDLNPHASWSARVGGCAGRFMPQRIPGRIAVPWRRALCGHPSKHLDTVGVPPLRVRPVAKSTLFSPAERGRARDTERTLSVLGGCLGTEAQN
jgi:hypothetical protein